MITPDQHVHMIAYATAAMSALIQANAQLDPMHQMSDDSIVDRAWDYAVQMRDREVKWAKPAEMEMGKLEFTDYV